MNLLLIAEISERSPLPAFGSEFKVHMEAKRHPAVRSASRTAWRLLELALQKLGISKPLQVRFTETGKPVFENSTLHFSLSHSAGLAALLLSDAPCAVDVEEIKNSVPERLAKRCMSAEEILLGCDFFECWTKKECIGKLDGRGISFHPSRMDTLNPEFADFFHTYRISDTGRQQYVLCALCMNGEKPEIQKIKPEELY